MFKSLLMTVALFFGFAASSAKADLYSDFYARGQDMFELDAAARQLVEGTLTEIFQSPNIPQNAAENLFNNYQQANAKQAFIDVVRNAYGDFPFEGADEFIAFADSITRTSEIPTPTPSQTVTFNVQPLKQAAGRLADFILKMRAMAALMESIPENQWAAADTQEKIDDLFKNHNYLLSSNSSDLDYARSEIISICAAENDTTIQNAINSADSTLAAMRPYITFFKKDGLSYPQTDSITQNDVDKKRAELNGDDTSHPINDEPIVTQTLDSDFLENLAAFERALMKASNYSAATYILLSPSLYSPTLDDTTTQYSQAISGAADVDAFAAAFKPFSDWIAAEDHVFIPDTEAAHIQLLHLVRVLKISLDKAVLNAKLAYDLKLLMNWYDTSPISPRLDSLNSQLSLDQRAQFVAAWNTFKQDLQTQFPESKQPPIATASGLANYSLLTQNMHVQMWGLVQSNGAGIQAYYNLFYPELRNCQATIEDSEARYQALLNTLNPLEASQAAAIWQEYQKNIVQLFSTTSN